MKKIILEFENPYSKAKLDLKPVVLRKTSSGGEDRPKPGPEDPDKWDPDDVGVDPSDPRPIPSRPDVGRQWDGPDIDPNRISVDTVNCLDDFKENWNWYIGYAAWYSFLAYPALRTTFGAIKATGRAAAGATGFLASPKDKLEAAHKNFKTHVDGISEKLKNVKNIKQDNAISKDSIAKLNQNKKNFSFKDPETRGRAMRWSILGLRTTHFLGSFVFVASLLAYHGPDWFKKWLNKKMNPNPDADYYLIQKSIGVLFQTAVVAETTLQHLMLKLNNNFYKRCIFLNTAVTSIVGAIIAGLLFKGKSKLYSIKSEKQFKDLLRSEDGIRTLVNNEASSVLQNFIKKFSDESVDILKGYDLDPKIQKKYMKTFLEEGSKSAYDVIKSNPKAAEINKKLVSKFEELERALISNSQITNSRAVSEGSKQAGELKAGQKELDNIMVSLSKSLKKSKWDPRISGDLDLAIKSSKGKVLDDVRSSFMGPARVYKQDLLVDSALSMQRVDKLLGSGQVTTRQAIKTYKNGIDENLLKFAEELTSPASTLAKTDAQKVKQLTESLSRLSKQDDLVEGALKALFPNGKTNIKANFVDKLLLTTKSKKIKDSQVLKASQEATEEAMKAILKINTRMSPSELKSIEKLIEKANEKYFNIFKQKYLGTAHNTVLERGGVLAVRVFLGGALAATVLNIVKYTVVKPPKPGTLESFEAENIAKSLAWDGWIPNPSARDEYQNALNWWVARTINNLDNTPATREQYPNAAGGASQMTIYKFFIFAYNGDFIKEQIGKGRFANRQEFDSDTIRQFVEDFLAYKVSDDGKFKKAIVRELDYDPGLYAVEDNQISTMAKSNIKERFKKFWRPILGGVMIVNCGLIEILESLNEDSAFWALNDEEKAKTLNAKLFGWSKARKIRALKSLRRFQSMWKKNLKKATQASEDGNLKESKEGKNTMEFKDLKSIVRQMIKENYGQGYGDYPYNSAAGSGEEPQEDFMQDWKDFEMALVRDESKDMAIAISKILIKDLELFGDVLDLVGKNQSVATEILSKFRKTEEKS